MPRDNDDAFPAAYQAAAVRPKITYPDYKASDNFVSWLSGLSTHVASAYGLQAAEDRDHLRTELLRLIPGKLALGEALDAYDRLTPEEKADYGTMVARLKEEFTDPRAEKRFNENTSYNKRKKGQTLKAFMQEIKRDMKRYSDTPATVYGAGGVVIANPEREKQGVRRFIRGIRDIEGNEDPEFKKDLRYQLPEKSDLTWAKVIKAATKYEASLEDSSSAAETDDDDDESEEEVESGDSKIRKGQKMKKKSKSKCVVAALSDQVYENQMRISKVETAQERTTLEINRLMVAQEMQSSLLQEISAKLDLALNFEISDDQPAEISILQQQQQSQPPKSRQQQPFLQQQQQQQPVRPKTYVYRPRDGGASYANLVQL